MTELVYKPNHGFMEIETKEEPKKDKPKKAKAEPKPVEEDEKDE